MQKDETNEDMPDNLVRRAYEIFQVPCKHDSCTPKYETSQFIDLDSHEVRRQFPRFDGYCPDCGAHLIAYASFEHYLAGDW